MRHKHIQPVQRPKMMIPSSALRASSVKVAQMELLPRAFEDIVSELCSSLFSVGNLVSCHFVEGEQLLLGDYSDG